MPGMARAHGIAVVALILGGTGAWMALALGGGDGSPAPSAPPSGPGPAAPAPSIPAPGQRVQVPGPAGAQNNPSPSPAGGAGESAAPAAPAAAPANLVVRVRAQADGAPVPGLRWTLWLDGARRTGVAEPGADIALSVREGATGEVLLEAFGFQPERRPVQVTPGVTALLEVTLAAHGAQTGVTITARDEHGAPVPQLRVDVWRLTADAAPDAPVDGSPLWSRRAGSDDGAYRLPDLEPGRYEVRAMAVDQDGGQRPLLAIRRRFEVTGSNHIPIDAAFVPGTCVRLRLTDPGGTALPATQDVRGIELRAFGPDGARRSLVWRGGERQATTVADGLLPPTSEVAEPLPAGAWRLEAWRGERLLGQCSALLLAGQRQEVTLALDASR